MKDPIEYYADYDLSQQSYGVFVTGKNEPCFLCNSLEFAEEKAEVMNLCHICANENKSQ